MRSGDLGSAGVGAGPHCAEWEGEGDGHRHEAGDLAMWHCSVDDSCKDDWKIVSLNSTQKGRMWLTWKTHGLQAHYKNDLHRSELSHTQVVAALDRDAQLGAEDDAGYADAGNECEV